MCRIDLYCKQYFAADNYVSKINPKQTRNVSYVRTGQELRCVVVQYSIL